MNSVRLVQTGTRSNTTRHKYTVEETWQTATLGRESMVFIIYTSNMTVCEQLRTFLTEKCHLPYFDIQYSRNGAQIIQRQLDINTEHVANTPMYSQIHAQFPSTKNSCCHGKRF